ncbi:MAG: transcription antitermination factor NusB [Acidimicrobiia bacterium]
MTIDTARVGALGALYAADSRSMDVIDVTKVSHRSAVIAEAVWENKEAIDAVITAASTRWRIERMPVVDRNVLRLGTYELLFTDVPVGVTISECVELAKQYSTADSGSFVNGVLSAVARQRDVAE